MCCKQHHKTGNTMTGIDYWNPLFCSPSPRDIDQVTKCHQQIPFDRVYAKYFVEREAYWHLRNFFLQHPEYTHMIIIPDDLVFTPQDVKSLYHDLREYDYPILSGICNVDLGEYKDKWSITQNLPHPVRPLKKCDDPTRKRAWLGWRWYAWFDDDTIKAEQQRQKSEIIRVPHSGFALQCIRRDVVEAIEFTTDGPDNGLANVETSSVDVMYSNSCAIAGIAIMVDPRIRMLHLRESGPVEITLGEPEIWHIKDSTKHIYKTNVHVPKMTQVMAPQTEMS